MIKHPNLPVLLLFIPVLFSQCANDDESPNVLAITNFSPTEGTVWTEVVINGTNFLGSLDENTVRFNGVKAPITGASANQLVVRVPATATSGNITVETGGQTVTSTEVFTVISEALTITGFTPNVGVAGTEVRIEGTNFSTIAIENKVHFNFIAAEVINATSSHLTVIVPAGATSGPIRVEMDGRRATTTTDFIVPPTITSFTPSQGVVGTWVTINGNNFSTSLTGNLVKFNDLMAVVSTATIDKLMVVVPEEAVTGRITIQVGDQMVKSASDFTILSNVWTKKAEFWSSHRVEAVSFTIGDKGYITTGFSGSDVLKDLWEYDPATDTWTRKADFDGASRRKAVGFSINGKGYIGTGLSHDVNNLFLKDFWEYDPATDQWTQKAALPGAARYDALGFSADGKGYIGTGFNGSYLTDFWEYDPVLDKWTAIAAFEGEGRWGALGFSLNGKGYIGTGKDQNGNYLNDFWEYDPSTGKWTEKATFKGSGRDGAAGFSIGTKGYISLGYMGTVIDNAAKDLWEYDPATDTWTEKATFEGESRFDAAGFSIGKKGYIGMGGRRDQFYSDFWEYTPE